MAQPTVVAVIDDLFFQAKVRTVLQHLGLAAEVVSCGKPLHARLQEGDVPVLVIVDLTLRSSDATSLIRGPAGRGTRAFGAHPGLWLARRRRDAKTGASGRRQPGRGQVGVRQTSAAVGAPICIRGRRKGACPGATGSGTGEGLLALDA